MTNQVRVPPWLQTLVDQTVADGEVQAWPGGEYPRLAIEVMDQIGESGDLDAQASLLQNVIAEVNRLQAIVAQGNEREVVGEVHTDR